MNYPIFYPVIGDNFPIYFGNEVTGLISANLKIYKQGVINPRNSSAGYVPLNLRGFDFVSAADIYGFSIDSSNNTDPNFYTASTWYTIVVSGMTSDSTPVHFIAGVFRLMPTSSSSSSGGSIPTGTMDVNVKSWNSVPVGHLPLTPTVPGRTLDVNATGEVGIDLSNVTLYGLGSYAPSGIVDSGTAQSATLNTLVLRSGAAFGNNTLVGGTVVIRSAATGAGQSRLITGNTGSILTVGSWAIVPTGVIIYDIFATPPGVSASPGGSAEG